ncbi:hypothetical protein [Streptomyces canus]|uniref:hypothetical protein n=1 Tax=Streptomyces canus TaxID=58343 RepID=UPI00386AB083
MDGERGVLVATYDGQIGQAAYAAPKGGLDYGRSRGFYTPGRRSLLMEDPSRPGVRMAGRSVPVTRAVAVLEHFQPSGQSYLFAPPLASRGYRRRRTAYDVLELYEEAVRQLTVENTALRQGATVLALPARARLTSTTHP